MGCFIEGFSLCLMTGSPLNFSRRGFFMSFSTICAWSASIVRHYKRNKEYLARRKMKHVKMQPMTYCMHRERIQIEKKELAFCIRNPSRRR